MDSGRLYGEGWSGDFGGWCPVQGEGEIDGWPFYFRARHRHWALSVAPPDGDPVDVSCGWACGWHVGALYRPWPHILGPNDHDAGYMPLRDVSWMMLQSVQAFRSWRAAFDRGEVGFPVVGAPPTRAPGPGRDWS